jgi:hypothetical protein
MTKYKGRDDSYLTFSTCPDCSQSIRGIPDLVIPVLPAVESKVQRTVTLKCKTCGELVVNQQSDNQQLVFMYEECDERS